jgi:hypothetical protein
MGAGAVQGRRRGHRRHGRGAALAVAALLITAACSVDAEPPLPTAPPVPAGWLEATDGDLSVTLPPWLVPFDTTAAVFANEVIEPGAEWIQLMAEGPGTAEPQPNPNETLEHWLRQRVDLGPGLGQPTILQVNRPAGPTVSIERLDRAGTRLAWRIAAYAIRTPRGVAFLQIDGPTDRWPARAADLALIPWLLRVEPRPPG